MGSDMCELQEFKNNTIWLKEYPIRYAGTAFNSRMAIIRLSGGGLFVHSPCLIDTGTKAAIDRLGRVEFIVAPGFYHYLFIESAQKAFPRAETWICPGIERKKPNLVFDGILGDRPNVSWQDDFDQVLLRGNRWIWEVAFFHKASRTLLLVDLIENITDATPGVNLSLKIWWTLVFRMWNRPKPAPEYQLGWQDKKAAAASLRKILAWDFERIIIAHGDLIEENAKAVAVNAWRRPLDG